MCRTAVAFGTGPVTNLSAYMYLLHMTECMHAVAESTGTACVLHSIIALLLTSLLRKSHPGV